MHDKLAHEQWRHERLGEKNKILWDEAALRWIKEKGSKKSIIDDVSKIRVLKSFRGIYLDDFNQDFIMDVIDELDCKDSTKNRYLALIRSIFNRSVKVWRFIDHAPTVIMYPEGNGRIRWLWPEEAKALIEALRPSYHADLALFALNTGLRLSNVLALDKNRIDRERRVAWYYADETKSGQALGVALNDVAMEIINRNWPKHTKFIFVNNLGQPVKGIDRRLWAAALSKAGIEDFRWHDLRHTWASWLVQRGVPVRVLQEMGGWKTLEIVQRYSHLAPDHLHEHAKLLNNVTKWDTDWTQAQMKEVLLIA
ncbi:site-specific integrase [Paralysiella testudinis]|uniref:Site-specific integrase n=1 Tax=Paralysiella testudinis TaxID=2809020 RepID=A0A892ZH87_9NEIS|nr:site-specific integrase [Paralysiella testudinis]